MKVRNASLDINYSKWKTVGSIWNVDVAEDAENQLDREGDKWSGVGTYQWR